MANEISVSASLTAAKGGVDVSTTISLTLNMSGEDMLDGTQIIGTTAEALLLGDVTAPPAYVLIKNLDTTNFVLVSVDNNFTNNVSTFGRLAPGGVLLFSPHSNVWLRADTASCRVAITHVEA